jgi:ATP synthase regulation protein NCA2
MGSSDIDNWIKDAKESMSVFWKEHVEMPVNVLLFVVLGPYFL